jgi:hypothetical protein
MSLINLSVFDEDEIKQTEGTVIYPLQDEDLYFLVPRVGGFKYQKQVQAIIKAQYGIYHDSNNTDMNLITAIWLGEYITDFGGAENGKTQEELVFSRENCRAIFNNKGYHQSLVPLLINKASNFEYFLTEEGREAIEELKKK